MGHTFIVGVYEWDPEKSILNTIKHGVSFKEALLAFGDLEGFSIVDRKHSTVNETRWLHFGKVENRVMTVRITFREGRIRIFGAGYWRKGRKHYEEKQKEKNR